MEIGELKAEFGKDLAFCGGIDVQEVLPTGTTSQVKTHVLDRIEKASKSGGYIAAPAHVIQPDTPVENVLAFFEAVKEAPTRRSSYPGRVQITPTGQTPSSTTRSRQIPR